MTTETILLVLAFVSGTFGVLFYLLGAQAAEIKQLKADYKAAWHACQPKKKV